MHSWCQGLMHQSGCRQCGKVTVRSWPRFFARVCGVSSKWSSGISHVVWRVLQNSYSIPAIAALPISCRSFRTPFRRFRGQAQTNRVSTRTTLLKNYWVFQFGCQRKTPTVSLFLQAFTKKKGMLFSQGIRRNEDRSISAWMSVYPTISTWVHLALVTILRIGN